MKLYTKKGDDGSTSLFGGRRVGKDDARIEAIGTVDELNSFIGHAVQCCRFDELSRTLQLVQNLLFDLGTELASPPQAATDSADAQPPRITGAHVELMEKAIDHVDAALPPLTRFILPGGSDLACRLHQARAVCRRAERCCVALCRAESAEDQTVVFLNRLSDLLFAMARSANQLEGVEDVPWKGGATDQSR